MKNRQTANGTTPPGTLDPSHPVDPRVAKHFLRMAWLTNPFAYIAMNTLIPLLPDIAARLELSTKLAGFVGSVWFFGRFFAFALLWKWTGWHYRGRWLAAAYLAMLASFGAILLIPNLAVVVIAQLVFGLGVGLIYYSSLFYSMDVGETKGEHGGFHEALIGAGLFAGPAIGAVALQITPRATSVSVWTVSGVLMLGFVALGGFARTLTRLRKPLSKH